MFHVMGHNTARLDILYMKGKPGRQNPMDLTTDAGMGLLGWLVVFVIHRTIDCIARRVYISDEVM